MHDLWINYRFVQYEEYVQWYDITCYLGNTLECLSLPNTLPLPGIVILSSTLICNMTPTKLLLGY